MSPHNFTLFRRCLPGLKSLTEMLALMKNLMHTHTQTHTYVHVHLFIYIQYVMNSSIIYEKNEYISRKYWSI